MYGKHVYWQQLKKFLFRIRSHRPKTWTLNYIKYVCIIFSSNDSNNVNLVDLTNLKFRMSVVDVTKEVAFVKNDIILSVLLFQVKEWLMGEGKGGSLFFGSREALLWARSPRIFFFKTKSIMFDSCLLINCSRALGFLYFLVSVVRQFTRGTLIKFREGSRAVLQ